MQSVDQRVSETFRRWAARGQGMEHWREPVCPEPAFAPFPGHVVAPVQVVDDGKRPTFISALARRLFAGPAASPAEESVEAKPRAMFRSAIAEMEILFTEKQRFGRDEYQYLLSSLAVCVEPLSFELVADSKGIAVQLAVARGDVPLIREQLGAFFPDCVLVPKDGALRNAWESAEGAYYSLVEFGLAREFMVPLARPKLDPHLALVGALGELERGEFALFQVILEPVRHPWAEHAMRSVSHGSGGPFFANAPELFAGAKQKVSAPLYGTVLRALARSAEPRRVHAIHRNVMGALRAFDALDGNSLIPFDQGVDGSYQDHLKDVFLRQSRRSGMILNADELAGLVHIPSSEVRSPKLRRQAGATRPVPSAAMGKSVVLGTNAHAGVSASVGLEAEQRFRHMHIVGASGTGKSTLLFNMARQDVDAGRGVAVLDPHGDLVDRLLGVIPRERVKDVVLLDPSDTEYPVGFNILHAHSELEKTLLASDLVSVFERLSTSWGDQMGSVLSHAVLAFLESDTGGSLLDLRRFLLEPAFRNSFLETVRDPEVAYYWRHGFTQLTGNKSVGPILTRLETFLTPKSIRYMVAQRENRLDFADILGTGKIFLAKLSQGAIGRENSYLLGTLLVSKFQQLAMARQSQAEQDRRDYFLYVDEFPNFMTPSMAEILAGARKYRLGLVLGHQELRQMEKDREVSSAVMGNAYSRICFRVGDADARALEAGFSHFEAKDLQNLGTGEAICRVERSDFDFNLNVALPILPDAAEALARRREVVEASRSAYGRPRADVEAALGIARRAYEGAAKPVTEAVTPLPALPAKPESNVPAPRRPDTLPVPAKPPPPTPGRGGKEHKYLQTFIKQWAEGMGWRTTIEAPVPGGSGSVDVLLSKGEVTVACEISVTTSIPHEIGNLEKCARGGFAYIASVSPEAKRAREIEAAAQVAVDPASFSRMRFLSPEGLFAFVQEMDAKHAAKETTVKGYKVKVNYRPVSEAERRAKTDEVSAVVAKSLRRMQTGKGGS